MIRSSLFLVLGVALSACFVPVMEDDGGFGGGAGGGLATGGGMNVGGGGGASCDGCRLPTGACLPRASTSANNCGVNGQACQVCSAGLVCSGGLCAIGSGGGGGGMNVGGGGGVPVGGGGGASCRGCVDASSGVCVPPEFTNQFACGLNGTVCRACGSGQACVNGACSAPVGGGGGGSCSGCILTTGQCLPFEFTSANSCGINGSACVACGSGQFCGMGQCINGTGGGGAVGGGGGSTCTGCVTSSGQCVPLEFTSVLNCGANGSACMACSGSNQTCSRGACVSIPVGGGGGTPVGGGGGSTCTGCVLGSGACVPIERTTVVNCGANGNACRACAAGQVCSLGACVGGSGGGGGTPVGGGGGGIPVGGGGGTCDGCFTASGQCVPLSMTSSFACGSNGSMCTQCGIGSTCTNGRCEPLTQPRRVGSACATDSECQAGLGSQGICRLVTGSGNARYQGGYCTLRCNAPGSTCPSGSSCVNVLASFGETDALCLDSCGFNDACRTPGYACYGVSSTTNVCWINPLPGPTGGGGGGMPIGGGAGGGGVPVGGGGGSPGCSATTCAGCCNGSTCVPFGSQTTSSCGPRGSQCQACAGGSTCSGGACVVPDAGVSPVGDACTSDLQCRPPNSGFCIAETVFGQPTGWPGGYCSASCNGTMCPSGSTCVDVEDGAAQNLVCLESCPAPRQGQSTCRFGYVCEVNFSAAGGPGICIPRCNTIGFNCFSNTTCNAASGYCTVVGP